MYLHVMAKQAAPSGSICLLFPVSGNGNIMGSYKSVKLCNSFISVFFYGMDLTQKHKSTFFRPLVLNQYLKEIFEEINETFLVKGNPFVKKKQHRYDALKVMRDMIDVKSRYPVMSSQNAKPKIIIIIIS